MDVPNYCLKAANFIYVLERENKHILTMYFSD